MKIVMSEEQSIKEILDTCGHYTGLTMGTSMKPLIHHQRDNIIIVKNTERLKKYDVALYVTPKNKYIMHRVIEVYDDHYVIVGDNLLNREYVTDDMICGVLVGFYKNGKHYVDCQNSKLYLLYSKIWVALLPIRRILLLPERGLGWIKRHLFKKGN
ncbi:MAG: S24/S26 family peptidase [Clostridiales bacterium]|nr:S24/S26 family peptidase [Clostridiales bacterium]